MRDGGRVKGGEDRLLAEVERFQRRLQALTNAESTHAMSQQSDVAQVADQLKSAVRDAIRQWTERLAESAPVKKLAEKYADRAILLVFGKVNSGKSTFVNLLVDELERAGAGSTGFAIKDGKQIHVDTRFAVGATETTARIQGIEVDDRLVILDLTGPALGDGGKSRTHETVHRQRGRRALAVSIELAGTGAGATRPQGGGGKKEAAPAGDYQERHARRGLV